ALEMDDSTYPNVLAMAEIEQYINLQTQMSKQMTIKLIYDHFGAIPYGWKALDIAGMLIDLLKNEKIRIRYNTMYLNPQESHKQLMNVFTNNVESAKAIILKREKVDTALISKVKRIVRNLFDTVSLPQDEDGMMLGIQELINEKVNEIHNYKQKYTNKNYPGLSLINKGPEYFDHFTTRLDNITYFNKLVEMEDDLIQWDDDFETVKDFFESNQKHLFDQGLAILERYEQNKSFFENEMNEAIGKSIKELKDILENPIPYSEIKDIPGLVESFNQAFEVILEDRKDETKDNLQNDFNSLKEFGNQEGVSDSTKSNIQRIWSNYLSEIDSTTDIYRVDGLIIQSERSK